MKCVTHTNREAECYCPICNQPICGECRDHLGACIYCAEQSCKDIKRDFYKRIFLSICTALIGIGIVLSVPSPINASYILGLLIAAILFAAVPFGWEALSKITPNIFLILPLVGWVIYFAIKLQISFFIGWIVIIPKCISIRKTLKTSQKIERNIIKIQNDLRNGNII